MFKTILKNYGTSILLLTGVIIGGICGIVFGEQTAVVKPIGDLFLNLMFVTIVPLIFFSISSAISSTNEMTRLGKILKNTVLVFVCTAVISALIAYFGSVLFNPLQGVDKSTFEGLLAPVKETEALGAGEMFVNTVSVSDFKLLFDKTSLLPLIIFTVAFGVATAAVGEKAKPMADFLNAGSEVILKIVGYVMKLAPVGLGCYFAYTIGQLGSQIVSGFINVFVLYLGMTLIYFFIFFTLYAFIAGKKEGVRMFWKNAIDPSLSAIATSSSAACIPVNLIATKKMGVPHDIAETVIPLGANIHKDGSVMTGVIKIVFLFALYGKDITGLNNMFLIVGIALIAGLVVGSIPSGGSTGEILMLSLCGFPMEMLGILMIISTILDIPATLLNSSGNTVSAMIVARLTEGKDWLKNSLATK